MHHERVTGSNLRVNIFMDNDGKATAINDNIPENEKNKATRGRDECPVSAINLKDN